MREWRRLLSQSLPGIWYEREVPCALCGAPGGPVCQNCQQEYFRPELNRCQNCGKLIASGATQCRDCKSGKGPQTLHQTVAWGHYTGLWKEFILDVKFKAQPRRLAEIARPFANWVVKNLPPVDGIVPVPLHTARLADRGFNQAEVISSLLHWELGLPIVQGLTRIKPTPTQVGLSRKGRLQNLQNAFAASEKNSLQGRVLWLIDDVTTTGATLEACSRVLLAAGAVRVYGLCLAAGLEEGSTDWEREKETCSNAQPYPQKEGFRDRDSLGYSHYPQGPVINLQTTKTVLLHQGS
ncbi:MAG: ComF family protein [Desulfitobacteriaceae bacterium]